MSRPPLVPIYRVGERLRASASPWPEGSEYSFGPSGHELTLFRSEITPTLIDDVGAGPAEFALIVESPIIVFAFRFGRAVPWSDAPYCWHTQPEFRQVIPSAEVCGEMRCLLWVSLVGSRDGIIHAQRGLTLSPEFTDTLGDAIRHQAMNPFDSRGCVRAVRAVFSGRGSVESRLSLASARAVGNS